MPKTSITNEFKLDTRNQFTSVDCIITLTVDGRELPAMNIVGKAVEDAVLKIRESVKESYAVVPPRVS